MTLSTKGRYAMVALADLALAEASTGHGDDLMSLAAVAKRQDISLPYLEQLFVKLRRAGLDYAEMACVTVHADWAACRAALGDARLFALTTKASRHHASVVPGDAATHDFRPGDAFVFGSESRGLPADVLADIGESHRLRLPLIPGNRSLNLSNAVAVMVYEAWRQQGFAGGA